MSKLAPSVDSFPPNASRLSDLRHINSSASSA
jgi:hypothetical protein